MNKINSKKVKNDLIKWIKNWFDENGKDCNAVIGISGGKDSSIVAKLCVEALGKDRVIGVLMPNGEQSDINYSLELVHELGIKHFIINIKDTFDSMINELKSNKIEISEQTLINLPARIRMTTLYAISQSFNGRVSNNCNMSENWVGYSTKYGDDAGDFSPLHSLTVTEVKQIGYELGLSNKFIDKVPSDGLCGKTDEDNLGFTYDILDKYIRTGVCENEDIKNLIDYKHKTNLFKLEPMKTFIY